MRKFLHRVEKESIKSPPTSGSKNVEGGVLMVCKSMGSNFEVAPAMLKAVHRGA